MHNSTFDSIVEATCRNTKEISAIAQFQEMDRALGSQTMVSCKSCHKLHILITLLG